ncbi:MAG: MBL fold metallo-hydrolase [Chloroflexi bacterium]|nr:MBL fold metallo-hydrolase [Chloroflexota bacterium]
MDIVWHGHSCFRLRGKDAAIATDPYDQSLGYPPLRLSAEVVTVSHQDPHHSYLAAVAGQPTLIDGPGEYEVASTFITGVATYRDKEKGRQSGRNTAYLIELDELVICHLGDLGHLLSADQIEALKDPDVLLIPVGGHCTISGAEAAEIVSQLEPKIVVPMHYQTGKVQVPLDPVDKFCKEMGVDSLAPQSKLAVTRSSLPEETTIVLLVPPA